MNSEHAYIMWNLILRLFYGAIFFIGCIVWPPGANLWILVLKNHLFAPGGWNMQHRIFFSIWCKCTHQDSWFYAFISRVYDYLKKLGFEISFSEKLET